MSEVKTTGILQNVLNQAKPDEIKSYLETYADSLAPDSRPFSTYMRTLLKEKNIRQQDVFLAADISEGYGYKLISEEKHTRQRDVILRLCFGGHFSLLETQRALRLYGMSPLYPRVTRDAALIVAINNGIYETGDVDALLLENALEPLYPCAGEN